MSVVQKKVEGSTVLVAVVVLVPLLSGFFGYQPAHAFDMSDAVHETLENNPDILGTRALHRATQDRIDQARADYFPNLTLRTTAGRVRSDTPTTRNSVGKARTLDPTEFSITMEQELFDGFNTLSTVNSKTYDSRATELDLLERSQVIALQAAQVYLEILKAQELVDLVQEHEKTHGKLLSLVRTRVSRQVGSASEVSEARSRMESVKAAVVQADLRLATALSRYPIVVGSPPPALNKMAGYPPPFTHMPSDIKAATAQAEQGSYELSAANMRLNKSKSDISVAKSSFYPNVKLELKHEQDYDTSGTPGKSEVQTAMVVMKYELFDGLADKYALSEKKHLHTRAQHTLESTRRSIVEKVNLAFNTYNTSKNRKQLFANQVRESKKVRNAYYQQYQVGRRTLIDLLDAESALFEARGNEINEEYQQVLAAYQLLALQGRFLSVINVNLASGS